MQQQIRFDYVERALVWIPTTIKKWCRQFCHQTDPVAKSPIGVPDTAKKTTTQKKKWRSF